MRIERATEIKSIEIRQNGHFQLVERGQNILTTNRIFYEVLVFRRILTSNLNPNYDKHSHEKEHRESRLIENVKGDAQRIFTDGA